MACSFFGQLFAWFFMYFPQDNGEGRAYTEYTQKNGADSIDISIATAPCFYAYPVLLAPSTSWTVSSLQWLEVYTQTKLTTNLLVHLQRDTSAWQFA
jgi:hypothetical protein